jgi:hypothetical protein
MMPKQPRPKVTIRPSRAEREATKRHLAGGQRIQDPDQPNTAATQPPEEATSLRPQRVTPNMPTYHVVPEQPAAPDAVRRDQDNDDANRPDVLPE